MFEVDCWFQRLICYTVVDCKIFEVQWMFSRDEVLRWWQTRRRGVHGIKVNIVVEIGSGLSVGFHFLRPGRWLEGVKLVVFCWHPRKWPHPQKWCSVDVHIFWWVQVLRVLFVEFVFVLVGVCAVWWLRLCVRGCFWMVHFWWLWLASYLRCGFYPPGWLLVSGRRFN